MKIQIPDNLKVVITITERIGVPTILCLLFGYLYFAKLDKLVTETAVIYSEIKAAAANADKEFEEIKREVRRGRRTREIETP